MELPWKKDHQSLLKVFVPRMVDTQVPDLWQQMPPCIGREREVIPLEDIFFNFFKGFGGTTSSEEAHKS